MKSHPKYLIVCNHIDAGTMLKLRLKGVLVRGLCGESLGGGGLKIHSQASPNAQGLNLFISLII